MKFVLFVEGQTERQCLPEFLKRWLDQELQQRVGIQIVKFNGWQHFYDDFEQKALAYINGPQQSQIVAVIGLLDLYGPTFYPQEIQSAEERHDWAVKHFEKKVGHPKFRMFFAVHEVEAWLLSQPEHLPTEVRSALPGRANHPETVNFNEPPAKLLDKIYKNRTGKGYKKIVHGRDLFQKLDPTIAAAKCPRFRALMAALKTLAKLAES